MSYPDSLILAEVCRSFKFLAPAHAGLLPDYLDRLGFPREAPEASDQEAS